MKRMLIIGGLACILVIGLWLASFCIVRAVWNVPKNGAATLAEYGQFGDSFGAVNALFSGLAFAGVVVALILQREDIDATLKAQQETANSLKRQTGLQALAAKLDAQRSVVEALAKLPERTQNSFSGPKGVNELERAVETLRHLANDVQHATTVGGTGAEGAERQ